MRSIRLPASLLAKRCGGSAMLWGPGERRELLCEHSDEFSSIAMNFPQAESRAPNPELLTCQVGQRKSFSFNEYFLRESCTLRRRSDRLSLKMDWPTLPINHLD